MTERILIAVDVQNDFLTASIRDEGHTINGVWIPTYKDGALAVPESRGILAPLVKEAYRCSLVVATRDFHPTTHVSFKERGGEWPMHCIAGSEGAQLDPQIDMVADIIVSKGTDSEKEAYSGFDGTLLSQALDPYRYMTNDVEILIGGLATEYCVFETAIDAKRLFPRANVVVLRDCSRGIWTHVSEQYLSAVLTRHGIDYREREG